MSGPVLEVRGLDVRFDTPDGVVRAVNDVSFDIGEGEAVGLVGESGSGKSQAALAVMGLLASNGRSGGSVRLAGRELLGLERPGLNRLRGAEMAMVFQDPMTSLNPYLTIGRQMTEVLERHRGMGRRAARAEAAAMLEAVHISDPGGRLDRYPHEFSGGMRQRVMIAMALLCRPALLIADEPTTSLDVTVQAQILALLAEIRREFSTAVLLITHDLGVVAQVCERVLVLYGGRIVEEGPAETLFHASRHPYTRCLLESLPRLDRPRDRALPAIPGQPPDPLDLPPGCPFEPRCPERLDVCAREMPPARPRGEGHRSACHAEDRR